jgi:hypothetical protein
MIMGLGKRSLDGQGGFFMVWPIPRSAQHKRCLETYELESIEVFIKLFSSFSK